MAGDEAHETGHATARDQVVRLGDVARQIVGTVGTPLSDDELRRLAKQAEIGQYVREREHDFSVEASRDERALAVEYERDEQDLDMRQWRNEQERRERIDRHRVEAAAGWVGVAQKALFVVVAAAAAYTALRAGWSAGDVTRLPELVR